MIPIGRGAGAETAEAWLQRLSRTLHVGLDGHIDSMTGDEADDLIHFAMRCAAARAEVIAEIRAGVEGLHRNQYTVGMALTAPMVAYYSVLALLPPTEPK